MVMRRVLLLGACVLLTPATLARPAAAAPDPAAFVRQLGNEGLSALAPGVSREQRRDRFRQLFAANFDMPSIARFVLGRYWRVASGQQREEFDRLFTQYVTMLYADKLQPFAGARLSVLGTRPDPGGALVMTEVTVKDHPIKMDWRLTEYDSSYKVSDVILDGVSMAATQRNQFSSLIQRTGGQVSGLLAAMRDKITADGGDAGGGKTPQLGSSSRRELSGVPPGTIAQPDFGTAEPAARSR